MRAAHGLGGPAIGILGALRGEKFDGNSRSSVQTPNGKGRIKEERG